MTSKRTDIHSAVCTSGAPAESSFTFRTAAEIANDAPDDVPWIACPWAAEGVITEAIGKPKEAGKTTFIMRLVRAVLKGMGFLGQPTSQTPVVYLTEERESTFREALKRAGLLESEDLHVLQWRDTFGHSWQSIVHAAVGKCEEVGARLLIIDTVLQFAQLTGDRENNAGDVLEIYRPLHAAAADGLAVISVRHERKSGGDVANAGRGSSAFAGAADIVLSIRKPEGNARSSIREIHALSRFEETPDVLAIELTDTGYIALGDSAAVANAEAKAAILAVAPTRQAEALTLDEFIAKTKVRRTTAQKALDQLTQAGNLQPIGKGVKGDPRRWIRPEIHAAGTQHVEVAETTVDGTSKPQNQEGAFTTAVPNVRIG